MPDEQDYAEFGRLLASPGTWSDQEAAHVKRLLVSQTDMVSACHPKDSGGRRRLQAVVDDIQAALEQYEAGRG